MTTPNPPTHRNMTARRLTRLLGISLVGLLAFSAPASAQLPGVPGLPATATVEQYAQTPMGSVYGYADAEGAVADADLAAATDAVPAPVPLPVSAYADQQASLQASMDGLTLDTATNADAAGLATLFIPTSLNAGLDGASLHGTAQLDGQAQAQLDASAEAENPVAEAAQHVAAFFGAVADFVGSWF